MHEVVSRSGPRDGGEGRWSLTHEADAPSRAAVVLARAKPEAGSEYDDPKALVLESFDALDAYELSDTNQFEKYVVGQGKELGPTGPVRAGVTQSFTPATDDAKVGRACGVFTATNAGEAGGWCAKGKRLPKPLDLSGYPALGLWVHGDGQGEALVFQLRDTAGRYAHWTVPITFTGWRLQRFTTAEARDFDWKQVEYVLFYYNNLPAQATCTLKLDDLKALPPAGGREAAAGSLRHRGRGRLGSRWRSALARQSPLTPRAASRCGRMASAATVPEHWGSGFCCGRAPTRWRCAVATPRPGRRADAGAAAGARVSARSAVSPRHALRACTLSWMPPVSTVTPHRPEGEPP